MPLTRWLTATCLVGLLLLPASPAVATPETPPASQPADQVAEGTPVESASSPRPSVTSARMSISAATEQSAVNGDVIAIHGRLLRNGNAAAGVGITITDETGEVSDSYTVTGSDGRFSTKYAVVEDQPDGWLTLTVSNEGETVAAARLNVAIRHTEVASAAPSDEADEITESETPTPEATPTPTPTPTPLAAQPTDAARASAGVADTSEGGVWGWFIAAFVGVAVIGVGATAALMFRDRKNRSQDDDFDLFNDDEEDDGN